MYRPRIIPTLLLKNNGLVKSVGFAKHKYIGDPINAVKIFNDLKADELLFLDIDATKNQSSIDLELIHNIAEEANMPFAIGGGISSLEQIQQLIQNGAERVVLGSIAAKNPEFVKEASNRFGKSTIIVCMDVKKGFLGKLKVVHTNAKVSSEYNPVQFAKLMEAYGAGEIIIQDVKRDGTMEGYDVELIREISSALTIPVTAIGGAGNYEHLQELIDLNIANGIASGSTFVYNDKNRGVLINYPSKSEIFE